MQCVRCSHPLPSRADRCVRCFALNPQNAPGPLAMPVNDSGPARPVRIRISEPAPKPVAVSFSDEPVELGDIDIEDAITEPESAPPSVPALAPTPATTPPPPPAAAPPAEVITDHIPRRADV